MHRLYVLAALAAAAVTAAPISVSAQGYFVPGASQPAKPAAAPVAPKPPAANPASATSAPAPTAAPTAAARPASPTIDGSPLAATAAQPLPPIPDLPPLPRGASPPAAVIGVMGVPDVMRASTAAQAVDRVIGERRQKLNDDAQKEQGTWRDLQQQLAAQRSTMSPEQIRTKERELQDRITNAQKDFRERTRIIQEAAQVSAGQIERVLVAVIREVADSHGMNLVLHREQVALNVSDFDITQQVADQLNKILPSVTIPPEGEAAPASAPAAAAAPHK